MRAVTFDEETAVLGFLEAMEKGLSSKVVGTSTLGVVERDHIQFAVLASPAAASLPAALLEGATAVGLPIGVLEDGEFHLDVQGAILVALHPKAQTIRVTEQAARLFLYGRNILGDSVLWHDHGLSRGDACIVCNARGEALGLGSVVGSFKGPREAVHPVQDLGTYLRDQDE